MASNTVRRAARALLLGAAVVLSGCDLWPTNSTASPAPAPAPTDPAVTGSISGIVAASTTGEPLPGVTVKAAGVSTSTAADGSYALAKVPAGNAQVVSFEANGYATGVFTVSVAASGAARASARLTPIGATQRFDAAAAATITVPGSVAQVALPAAGLVTGSGAAATGQVRVEVTAIDPAANPANMPGNYTAQLTGGGTGRIESFGAIKVTLTDASGARLNLASGKTATIRIPLSTRSTNPPASVPLFYLNETTGLWIQEGSATLAGTAPNQYYEGTVSHFTFWNADQVSDTIRVSGCLQDANGARVSGGRRQQHRQRLLRQRRHRHRRERKLHRRHAQGRRGNDRGRTRQPCLQRRSRRPLGSRLHPAWLPGVPGGGQRHAADDRRAAAVADRVPGGYGYFRVEAIGSPLLKYQWARNGVAIAGATASTYYQSGVTAADSGASFTVTVSNSFGSVTSAAAVLTVNVTPQAPTITGQPLARTVNVGATATFDVSAQSNGGTLGYQWRRNGTPIPGATASSYTTPATVAGDSGTAFSVVVSSSNGTSVTSDPAVLTVLVPTPLSIAVQPVSVSLNVGQSASFSVTATGGSAPLSYQWLRDGSPVAGATAVSYTTPAATLADSGRRYSVVVSSGSESVTSSAATLTVTQPVGANGYYLLAAAGPGWKAASPSPTAHSRHRPRPCWPSTPARRPPVPSPWSRPGRRRRCSSARSKAR